jgi:hypothetical protein
LIFRGRDVGTESLDADSVWKVLDVFIFDLLIDSRGLGISSEELLVDFLGLLLQLLLWNSLLRLLLALNVLDALDELLLVLFSW